MLDYIRELSENLTHIVSEKGMHTVYELIILYINFSYGEKK